MSRLETNVDQSAKAIQTQLTQAEIKVGSRLDQIEDAMRSCFDRAEARAARRFHAVMQCLLLLYVCMLNNMDLLQRVLYQIPRSMLRQASTIFEDAHGYISHINIDFVQSWEVRSDVLNVGKWC